MDMYVITPDAPNTALHIGTALTPRHVFLFRSYPYRDLTTVAAWHNFLSAPGNTLYDSDDFGDRQALAAVWPRMIARPGQAAVTDFDEADEVRLRVVRDEDGWGGVAGQPLSTVDFTRLTVAL